MALRTFRSNPSLGGFGSGEADGDAFCQVVKELVDNAVDACRSCTILVPHDDDDDDDEDAASRSAAARRRRAPAGARGRGRGRSNRPQRPSGSSPAPKKRVRVVIEPFDARKHIVSGGSESGASQGGDLQELRRSDELLRVTVTDNGAGMKDIQACVDPFSTSKGGHGHESDGATLSDDRPSPGAPEQATAGRYGIGLTLCLLHTQRLVPDSCAVIRSATAEQPEWTQVTCVVATDRVDCLPSSPVPKGQAGESGTTVSILVPGGEIAYSAYPRLAEYFARFNLSRGLPCTLEILAPILSPVPLAVRPVSSESDARGARTDSFRTKKARQSSSTDFRESIRRGMELYLEHQVKLENVAHSMVPIRFNAGSAPLDGGGQVGSNNGTDPDRPVLEVAFVVDAGAGGDDADDQDEIQWPAPDGSDCGALALIRMVNGVPLLDTSEAIACGFVQGVASKKRLWSSFGLAVAHLANDGGTCKASLARAPTFSIRDSDQVAPFFQRGAHALFQGGLEEEVDDDDECREDDGFDTGECISADEWRKRKRRAGRVVRSPQLLPAKVRLAKCFCILQIHAKPSALPLPTLSKGRLPLDNDAIDQALEVGLTDCLRQLQKSNPTLLLTTSQLRVVERDYRYVPAISEALARMVVNCSDRSQHEELVGTISRWAVPLRNHQTTPRRPAMIDLSRDDNDDDASTNGHVMTLTTTKDLIESRLGLALSSAGTKKKKKKSETHSRRIRKHGRSQNENDDPNQVLDRCTRWADLFEDLQGSDDNDGTTQVKQTGETAWANEDDDDGWL